MALSLSPLRDPQDEAPIRLCPACGGEIWGGELMVRWDEGDYICTDCFREKVEEMLAVRPGTLASEMGLEVQKA